jgi:hypothetical protein
MLGIAVVAILAIAVLVALFASCFSTVEKSERAPRQRYRSNLVGLAAVLVGCLVIGGCHTASAVSKVPGAVYSDVLGSPGKSSVDTSAQSQREFDTAGKSIIRAPGSETAYGGNVVIASLPNTQGSYSPGGSRPPAPTPRSPSKAYYNAGFEDGFGAKDLPQRRL